MNCVPDSKTKAPIDAMTGTKPSPYHTVGHSAPRRELPEKLNGSAQYSADISLPGMLHGVIVRSPHPHANVLSVDAADALALPGVHAVVTPADAPATWLAPDMAVLDTRVRFAGDEVAAVAADDLHTAQRAAALVRVEYEPLPFVTDPVAALEPDAPQIHPQGNLAIPEPLALQRGGRRGGICRRRHHPGGDVPSADALGDPAGAPGRAGGVGREQPDGVEVDARRPRGPNGVSGCA